MASKRPRSQESIPVEEATAPATAATPALAAPPLSAVAARKAAQLAASQSQDPTILPRHAQRSDDESDIEEAIEDALQVALHSDDDEQQQQQLLRADAKLNRQSRPKPKAKGAGRYWAPTLDEDTTSRPPTRPPSTAPSTEMDLDGETFEEAARSTGKGKLGRGKRQRREKSAFLDPSCFSSFTPTAGTNAFRLQLPVDAGQQVDSALFCLATGETLIIHGNYTITPLVGSTSMLGSILCPSPSSSPVVDLAALAPNSALAQRVYSPSSHPLPPLSALPAPTASTSTATHPSTLAFANGDTLDLTPFAAVVLVQELNTQVEGVETVLRSSGMGCGNGMWEVPTAGRWGGQSWNLITEPTPSLTSLRSLDSWDATLDSFGARTRRSRASHAAVNASDSEEQEDDAAEENAAGGAERLVLLVEGPKRVGKSTFTKMLLNRLLSRYETVAYLDTDLGQPEFTTPGFVSLNALQQPVLGPSFTHLSLPVSSHYLGTTSPASNPSAYLAAISSLLSTFSLDLEYPLVDELPRPHRRGAAAAAPGASRIRDRVPLIINTQGWIKGLGADLLEKIKSEARPTAVFSFEPAAEEGEGGAWNGQEPAIAPERTYQDPSCQVYRLQGAPSSPLDSKWSAADLRTLAFLSYFHSIFPFSPSTSSTVRTNTLPVSWDYSTPLVRRPPFALDWTVAEGQLKGVHLLDSDVPYEQVLYALNGSVVALVCATEVDEDSSTSVDADAATSAAFPLSHTPPSPSNTRSPGLALVRSIDSTSHTLHLLTPVPFSGPVSLLKGSIDLPLPLLLDFTASEEEQAKGVCGTEWREVPYLSKVEGEEGRRKVRRNVMRRGQA